MRIVGSSYQGHRDFGYYADGVIGSTSAAQLILPEQPSRSSLFLQNTSSHVLWVGFGSARATATLTGAIVTAVAVTNAGFGFSRAPIVTFFGGGIFPQQGQYPANTSYIGAGGPSFPAPNHPAQAHCVMTGSAPNMTVASITVDDGGNGYVIAPYVLISNDILDPNGCFDPSASSGSGFQLAAGQSIYENESVVVTDAISAFCATLSATFACRYTP